MLPGPRTLANAPIAGRVDRPSNDGGADNWRARGSLRRTSRPRAASHPGTRTTLPSEILAFDIGATWFRSAVCSSSGTLTSRAARPAVSFRSHPECSVPHLQGLLVDYLVDEAERLRGGHATACEVAVSFGAALNGHNGFVYDSGPLWGPNSRPLDLLQVLRQRAPHLRWRIVNDVTAALLRHVAADPARVHGRTALITVSSGIAARVYDHARRCVPLDPEHGLQGEIGHLPVECSFAGRRLSLRCDCGGVDHLNAFTSGRGITAVLGELARWPDSGFAASQLAQQGTAPAKAGEALAAAVLAGDPWSRRVLAAVLQPMARVLTVMLAHDPELDPILFVGGVATGLGETFVATLCEQLEAIGLYQVTTRDPGYFRRRLRLGSGDDDSGLLGCGVAARLAPEVLR